MSLVWRGRPDAEVPPPGPGGWARAVARGLPLVLLLVMGLLTMLAIRVVEAAIRGPRRPVSPWVTVLVCRGALRLLGLRAERVGVPATGPGLLAANHSSWLDILVLNAGQPLVFVSKAEVAGWPGIGGLARATGTLFVRRDARAEAGAQAEAVAERLRLGQRLALFPEGTSTDNGTVLPFRPALFEALRAERLPPGVAVQPVTLAYGAPPGRDAPFLAWYGDMEFGPHGLAVLAAPRGGRVRVTYHPPIPSGGRDRKALALAAERAVRAAL
ncbi:lysophospholipid acyltransferase family protein [Rubellimicrobium aerolatum]|uniref:Lysophospholipid acyltransferase family protein n=1 Tax=Rubellimicrobium aerolatum TaxID=490979 RepID=A0ABW0S847_9RHOB|nr:1-acyl-sn-glycerol-3-phosphate acyltransferase [Rubellimicrobium aerolatum]